MPRFLVSPILQHETVAGNVVFDTACEGSGLRGPSRRRNLRVDVVGGDMLQDGLSAIGELTTLGRTSGRPHTVPLRLVYYREKFYASRRDTSSDWCRNLMTNPHVTLRIGGREFRGSARVVKDDRLAEKVSSLKYGDERSLRARIMVEIVPDPG